MRTIDHSTTFSHLIQPHNHATNSTRVHNVNLNVSHNNVTTYSNGKTKIPFTSLLAGTVPILIILSLIFVIKYISSKIAGRRSRRRREANVKWIEQELLKNRSFPPIPHEKIGNNRKNHNLISANVPAFNNRMLVYAIDEEKHIQEMNQQHYEEKKDVALSTLLRLMLSYQVGTKNMPILNDSAKNYSDYKIHSESWEQIQSEIYHKRIMSSTNLTNGNGRKQSRTNSSSLRRSESWSEEGPFRKDAVNLSAAHYIRQRTIQKDDDVQSRYEWHFPMFFRRKLLPTMINRNFQRYRDKVKRRLSIQKVYNAECSQFTSPKFRGKSDKSKSTSIQRSFYVTK
ncbi:hypothetical protein SNEBB_001749 [Seison nebaliae]|nr:hypothetical protein SNEBB_001749 [Seison nebaliae]